MWVYHSTSRAMRGSVVHVQECHCFRQKYALYDTFSLEPTFALLKGTHANDIHRTGVLEKHYIQPAPSFWLLLKCQQHHGYWFIAALQCACSCLSYVGDCNCNAVEPNSCKYSANISLLLGSEIFLCGFFYKKKNVNEKNRNEKKWNNHCFCATHFF